MFKLNILAIFTTLCAACTVADLPADGGQSGEESIFCGAVSSTALADDEASVLGFGRAEIDALAGGAHAGSLAYEAGGSSPLSLTVTLGGAVFQDMEWVDDSGAEATPTTEMACADLVSVEATVVFSTEDGAFAESWDTDVEAAMAESASFWVDLDLDALGGSFTYTPDAAYDEVNAWADATFDSGGAHGEIAGQGVQSTGDGPDDTVSATSLAIASW